jgi:acyl carrier protein
MLPDGSIEFAGRKDLQVKICGMRIELGEINTSLTQHPAVQQAVTLALDDAKGEKRLVSYVIPSDSNKPSAKDLDDHLRRRLADYMIPAAYMVLEALPLTPNGKIDYHALPEPIQMKSETAYAAPRNDVERQLVAIWTDLLQIGQIGIHDNFFQLGGQSLLATQVMARIQKVLGIELPLRIIFQSPTIADLAAAVERARGRGLARRMPAIGSISRETRRIHLTSQKIRKNTDALKRTIDEGGEDS